MLGHVQLFVTLCTVARQAPLSMEFSRQECWRGLPCSLPADLPDPGIELTSHISCIGRQILYHSYHLESLWAVLCSNQTYRTEREDTRIFGPGCASSIASWPSASKLQLIFEQNYVNHKSSSQVALVVENQCRRHKRPRFNPWIGNPLQYSYLENPMDRGKPQAAIHRVAKSRTRSDLSHKHGASYLNWLFFEADHPMNLLNLFWLINEISCLENPMDRGA